MAERSQYLGYNFSSPICGNLIPQRLQNLCIRDYAQSRKLALTFSVSEYFDSKPSLMLFTQLEDPATLKGLIFYSLLLLPQDDRKRREFFARTSQAGIELHFALEDLTLTPCGTGGPAGPTSDEIERLYRIARDPRLNETREALLQLNNVAE